MRLPDRQRIRANLCSILANDILGVRVCVSRSVTARTHWSASSWRSDDDRTTLSVVRACQNTLISCTFGRDSWIRTGASCSQSYRGLTSRGICPEDPQGTVRSATDSSESWCARTSACNAG